MISNLNGNLWRIQPLALATVLFAAPALAKEPVRLVDLKPAKAEFGMAKDASGISQMEGDGSYDLGTHWYHPGARDFWPEKQKVIKVEDPDFALPEGTQYLSDRMDCFAVGGYFVTGVGLWTKTRNMYHYLDYEVPQGAKTLTGTVMVSDDPIGHFRGAGAKTCNQQFEFLVFVDGDQVQKVSQTRLSKPWGSGEEIAKLEVAIPEGAKKIRFKVEATGWGDGNHNIEVVLSDAAFGF
jgi:hypothetical protein